MWQTYKAAWLGRYILDGYAIADDPTELERLAVLGAAQNLSIDDALTLLGSRCVDIYLNNAAFWAAVPTNVWEYTLGGYQVLKKWLSYREAPLLGRPLHEAEARYFS
jgi:hypothetical protein